MKVLVISHMYPSTFNHMSGIFVHKQVKELIKLGCEVKVISPVPLAPFPLNKISTKWKKYSQIPKKNVIDGVEVYYPRYIEFPKGYFFAKSGYRMYKSIKSIAKNLNEIYKFDLIQSHVALPDGYCGMILSKELNLPHVVTIHGQDFQCTINRSEKLKRKVFEVLNEVDKSIVVSNKLKNVVKSEKFINKIEVVNNGIDVEDCKSNNGETSINTNECINILSASNLIKTKGLEFNLKAISKLVNKYSNIKYYIIGDGEEKENLSRLAKELNIYNNIVFLGRLNHNEVMNYMAQCDIFSLPSWKEGFGVVYVEAMLQGKPVIGIKGEGIEDVIVNKENGMLVKPKNVDELVGALEFLITNSKKAEIIGEKAKQTVINDFTWKNNAQKTIKIYNSIM
ncbi:glycosyltransferase [Haloimpatiens sp. FM7330]|uniref:glycosyltransferase n=1 Tax=Haloimpatiens sp. FM7330 TaxID=3298610 RepID=UPI003645984A